MNKRSKIYIAGHSGLIGSAVFRRFTQENTYALVTRGHADLDLTQQAEVEEFFDRERPDYVILAAGKVGGIIDNQTFPADFISHNISIQSNVICSAHRYQVKRLILFASSCMYPRECSQPMSENSLFTGKLEASSLSYAISKLAGMQMCLAFNQQYKYNKFIPIIPNSVYGPNDNFDLNSCHVLSALIRRFHEAKVSGLTSVKLWGSGSARREFVYVDDVADICFSLLQENFPQLELPINVGSGEDVSIKELAKTISKIIGFYGRIDWDTAKPDGAPKKFLDSSRALSLGWQPKVDLVQGLKLTYDWYCKTYEI